MRLLISVIDPTEVAAALAGGADLIDVKDPAQGALGAAGPEVLRAVRARTPAPVELSAALGDIPHPPGTLALAAHAAADCGADYLKVGLRDSSSEAAVRLLTGLRVAAHATNPRTRCVAVAYADADRVGALPPAKVPRLASEAGLHGVMLDTALKDGRSSFDALGDAGVADFLRTARALGLFTGLAGSLAPEDLRRARELKVDVVGFRGAACEGGRNGRVSEPRVRALRAALGLSEPVFPGTRRA